MIDVVIVAKNEQRHLDAVLSALKKQDEFTGEIRIIVVDNGSTDDTIAIAQEHGAVVMQQTGSLGRARNIGIAYSASNLVAFLDAHSVPSLNWAHSMVEAFEEHENIGAVMGSIENISERPGTQLFARSSIFSSPERLRQSTISGLSSPLPWIPTGNCMYSRAALNDVGGFDQTLFRCEDTDLAWRVVLQGYQLRYVPEARVKHYDRAGATSYLRKYYNYGAGAADLAQIYGLQQKMERTEKLRGTKRLLDICYQIGYKAKRNHAKHASLGRFPQLVDEKFRKPFIWTSQTNLALSRQVVYWSATSDTCVCVDIQNSSRFVFEDSSAFIFNLLAGGTERRQVIHKLCTEYDITEPEASSDVDEFVKHLLQENILLNCPSAVESDAATPLESPKEPTEV